MVILVNERDEHTGEAGKMEAHEHGLLHRAFSIFIFNQAGELLLQRRALGKYHSAGLWTNTCCSHPLPGEETMLAATRRLQEEMGFAVPIVKVFDFVYKAAFDNGLTEHEFDHVFVGEYDGSIPFNGEEVMEIAYRSMNEVEAELSKEPQKFTRWFQLCFPRIRAWWELEYKKIA